MIVAHPFYLTKHSKPIKIKQKYDVGGVSTLVHVHGCTYTIIQYKTNRQTNKYSDIQPWNQ